MLFAGSALKMPLRIATLREYESERYRTIRGCIDARSDRSGDDAWDCVGDQEGKFAENQQKFWQTSPTTNISRGVPPERTPRVMPEVRSALNLADSGCEGFGWGHCSTQGGPLGWFLWLRASS